MEQGFKYVCWLKLDSTLIIYLLIGNWNGLKLKEWIEIKTKNKNKKNGLK